MTTMTTMTITTTHELGIVKVMAPGTGSRGSSSVHLKGSLRLLRPPGWIRVFSWGPIVQGYLNLLGERIVTSEQVLLILYTGNLT